MLIADTVRVSFGNYWMLVKSIYASTNVRTPSHNASIGAYSITLSSRTLNLSLSLLLSSNPTTPLQSSRALKLSADHAGISSSEIPRHMRNMRVQIGCGSETESVIAAASFSGDMKRYAMVL